MDDCVLMPVIAVRPESLHPCPDIDAIRPAIARENEEQLAVMPKVQVVPPQLAPTLAVGQHKFVCPAIEHPNALCLSPFGLPAFALWGCVIGEAQLVVQRNRHARAWRPFGVFVERDHLNYF